VEGRSKNKAFSVKIGERVMADQSVSFYVVMEVLFGFTIMLLFGIDSPLKTMLH
jgi:hypothetical protein